MVTHPLRSRCAARAPRPAFGTTLGSTDPSTPYYLRPEFVLVILAAWIVTPPLIGWWRSERAELG